MDSFSTCGSQGSYLDCQVWQSSPGEPFWSFSALDPKQPRAVSEGQQKVVALGVFPCWFIASFFCILRAHLQRLPRLAPGYLKISLTFVPHQPPTPKCSSQIQAGGEATVFCADLGLSLPTSPHPLQNGGLSPGLHRASVHQALSALLRLGMTLLRCCSSRASRQCQPSAAAVCTQALGRRWLIRISLGHKGKRKNTLTETLDQ